MTSAQGNRFVDIAFASDPLASPPTWTSGLPILDSLTVTRGRPHELEPAQPGQATVRLDNTTGDFTPAKTSSPVYPNVVPGKRLRLRVTPPAPYNTVRDVFSGFVESWSAEINDGMKPTTAVTAMDAFSGPLSTVKLASSLAQEILELPADAYYPMTEQTGAFRDLTGNEDPATLTRVLSSGSVQRGGTALAASDPSGNPTFVTSSNHLGGYLARLHPTLTPAGGFTVAVAVQTSESYQQSPISQTDSDGDLQWRIDVTDTATAFVLEGNVSLYAVTDVSVTDGLPHFLTAVLTSDAKTARLYIDGTLQGEDGSGTALTFPTSPYAVVAAANSLRGAPTFFTGTVGHVALWRQPLAASPIGVLYDAFLGFPGEKAGARIARILDYANWPAGDRDLSAGVSDLLTDNLSGQTVLQAIQTAAADDLGVFFMSRGGLATFRDRHVVLNLNGAFTFQLGTSGLEYEGDVTFEMDTSNIRNDITITSPAGVSRAVSQGSVDAYHRRTYDRTMNVSLEDVRQAASWLIHLYADPQPRIGTLTLDPVTAPQLWDPATIIDVGELIRLENLPAPSPYTAMNAVVDSISITSDENSFRVSFGLSPAPPRVFIPEDTTYGFVESFVMPY